MQADEKRRAQRKEVVLHATMTCEVVHWFSSEMEIETMNMSRTGALIAAPELLIPGDHCTITVANPNGGYGEIPVRVVWGERNDEGVYRVGVEFRQLSPDEAALVREHLLHSVK